MKNNNLESTVSRVFDDYPVSRPKSGVDLAVGSRSVPDWAQWVVVFVCAWAFLAWLMVPF